MSCHFQNINIKNYPQGRERKCKVGDFRKQGIGLPWGLKVPVTWEVEGLTPDGESLGGQLRAKDALDWGGGVSAGNLLVSLGQRLLPKQSASFLPCSWTVTATSCGFCAI